MFEKSFSNQHIFSNTNGQLVLIDAKIWLYVDKGTKPNTNYNIISPVPGLITQHDGESAKSVYATHFL